MNKIDRYVPQLDSEALRFFEMVARCGNVTRAAEQLHRTQSAVSVQIRKLEDDLGQELFNREPRGMALTAAGERLLAASKPILAMLSQAAVSMVADPIEGSVSVGIPDDYGLEPLASVLADFAGLHPRIEVNITCGFSAGFAEAVKKGDLDLAVYAGEMEDARGEVLLSEQTVWATGPQGAPEQTSPLPLALFDRACWWRDAALEALAEAGRDYRIAYTSESVAGVKAAVSAGLAIGVLARSTLDTAMRALGPADGFPPLPASNLVMLKAKHAPPAPTEAMMQAIRRAFATGPEPAHA
ncbi:MAG: LysR family transcriptional regulator [Pseudomonadota bacterium]